MQNLFPAEILFLYLYVTLGMDLDLFWTLGVTAYYIQLNVTQCHTYHDRPREAPYKVSPAKIQIFALKGGNFSVQKVEYMIRIVT
jgi:hypothetical protein